MTATMIRRDPPTSPQRYPKVPNISADLLPEEIVAARRGRRTRAWVLAILVLVVALLAGWYVQTVRQKTAADERLQTLSVQEAALRRSEQNDYVDVVGVQSQITIMDSQLKTAMADDLPWAALFARLIAAADNAGVRLTEMTGMLTTAGTSGAAAGSSAADTTLPSTSRAATIGTFTLSGTAPDKPSVATFVRVLGTLGSVANPYLTSATEINNGVQYSLRVDITDTARCGRFTGTCKTGGK